MSQNPAISKLPGFVCAATEERLLTKELLCKEQPPLPFQTGVGDGIGPFTQASAGGLTSEPSAAAQRPRKAQGLALRLLTQPDPQQGSSPAALGSAMWAETPAWEPSGGGTGDVCPQAVLGQRGLGSCGISRT